MIRLFIVFLVLGSLGAYLFYMWGTLNNLDAAITQQSLVQIGHCVVDLLKLGVVGSVLTGLYKVATSIFGGE